MSKASEHSTFKEQYPLSPCFTKCECAAPTESILGMLAFLLVIDLSDKIKVELPSLTAVSHSSLIDSILSFKLEFISKVQSMILIFLEKILLNFLIENSLKLDYLIQKYLLQLYYQNPEYFLNYQTLFLDS